MIAEMKSDCELPKGWVSTELGKIALVNPRLPGQEFPDDAKVSFVPMRAVEKRTGRINLSMTRSYSGVRKGYTPFINGDIIFAKITPCMENGKVAVAKNLHNGVGFGSTEFHVVRLIQDGGSAKFFFYFLLQEGVRKDARREMTGSAGQLRVPADYMRQLTVPLPPLVEQRRIVAKIEELFARLDAGVEALKKAKLQLSRYRKAVLKSAFEGKLTEEWREAHKDELGPASVLLQRIGKERPEGIREKRRKRGKLLPLDASKLSKIPDGWLWTKLGHVLFVQGGFAFKSRNYKKQGVPLVRISNIQDRRVDFGGGTVFLDNSCVEQYSDFRVQKGDILVALSGATTGKFGTYEKDEIALLNQRVGRLRFYNASMVSSPFVFNYIRIIREQILRKAYGAAQPNISPRDLGEIPIPFPSYREQQKIAEEVERRFSVAHEIEKTIEESLTRAERLRQSILKRAFEGKLVPQDSSDEPPEKLLERIKKEKERRQAELKARGKHTKHKAQKRRRRSSAK